MRVSREPTERGNELADYPTWYEFKKDLEKEAGRKLLNANWFQVKPFEPLPWNESHLQSAIGKLERKGELRPDQGRNVNLPAAKPYKELMMAY